MKSILLSSISENSGPILSKWISYRGCFFSQSAGVLLSLSSLTSSSWSPLIINLQFIMSASGLKQLKILFIYLYQLMGPSCCKMVNNVDPTVHSAMQKIIEPVEYQNSLNSNAGKVKHTMQDYSLFDGYQIFHEPALTPLVAAVLDSKISITMGYQSNHSVIKHVSIHQAYIDQFKTDELYANSQSEIFAMSILKNNTPAEIEQLPIYFKFKKTGVVYNGEWKKIKGVRIPHGKGRCYYPNQSYFQGLFKEGIPHYFGLYISPKGDYYEGEIKFGRAQGSGCYISDQGLGNKVQYRGSFKNNQRHGEGEEKSVDYHFKGIFQYDEKVSGTLKYNGIVYQGQFHNDKYHGKGKLTLPGAGGVYLGTFSDGSQNGYGQYSWPDGSFYRGNFKDGKREGYGQYYNASNQSTAKGTWKEGILNGNGQYINRNSQKIKCIWDNNKIAGIIN